MQIPTTPLAAHPRVESLREPYEALKQTFESRAREQLEPAEQADLRQLEQNLQRLAELKPHLSSDPSVPLDLFEEAVAANNESRALQSQALAIAERHRRFPASLCIYGTPGQTDLVTSLAWEQARLSPELQELGYQEARYSLSFDRENRDLQAQAHLVRRDGTPDPHFLHYRICMADHGHWRGAHLTLGAADGCKQFEATPLAVGSEDLYVRDTSRRSHWNAAEQAFVAQALTDLGVGWLVPTLCPHCK